ncbi:MAG: DNA polymerase III subunit alpha [Deltaproteobacteria bacterium]|nr:DNA polymerase III subunit alpha [Deltaproteobacteria bacterium]
MRYLPLLVHSAFSFLHGSFQPADLVEAVAARGGPGVTLADRAGLYGMVRLARAGRSRGLYTQTGALLTLAGGGELVLYPQNAAGHAALCRLITRAHLEHPRGAPRLEEAWLAEATDLVGLLPGRQILAAGPFWLAGVKGLFPGPLFLGLPGAEVSPPQRDQLRELAAAAGLTAVAAPEVVALDQAGLAAHRSLVQIAQTIHHRGVEPLSAGGVLPSDEELARLYGPAELAATWRVADLCPFELPLGRRWLPDYPLPPGQTPAQALARRAWRELARRRPLLDTAYARRLQRELAAIEAFGFAAYFLWVGEIYAFARQRGIRCTLRGSAAGSLVCWLLTGGVDPLSYDLLFERFLNDGRHEPPDVDLDFDSLRRDEVLRFIMGRFPGRAAMVATVPTFRARSAIRELVVSTTGDQDLAGRLTALIPYHTRANRLSVLLGRTPELAGHPLGGHPDLLAAAAAISGLPRQLSVHLGGVALGPLDELVPLEMSAQDLPVIQLDKDDAADLGLIKLDLLGLRMHSALAHSLELLDQKGRAVELDRLPLDDPAVYELLRTTDTVGVFQVESPGQRGLLGRLQPTDFQDLMVDISLFRPGPMRADMVTPYLERRAGRQPVVYPHPALEPVLADTLGVLVFQEQVLKIAHELAGLTYGEADGLRRAMTHRRSAAEMDRMRGSFVESCLGRGVDEGVALLMWDQVSSFAAYGFPKAHAAAFAHIAYQSAWLRAHHPLEFFLGLLNAGHVGGYPPRVLLNEARRTGIAILPPHLNLSGEGCRPENGGIRVGLLTIRGLGPAGVARILAAREKDGPFASAGEFAARSKLNRAQLRVLDELGLTAVASLRQGWGAEEKSAAPPGRGEIRAAG